MSVAIVDTPTPSKATKNKSAKPQPSAQKKTYPSPELPTFPLEVGYREVFDPATGAYQQLPLTLLELLYPTEEDIGAVKMAQSPLHDLWSRLLATMLQSYLAIQGWLIFHDVLVHWGRRRAPHKSPDITVIAGGHFPPEGEKSYRVGRDGPPPPFVVEITSEETREADLHEKKLFYAAIGVKEYLIIDLLTTTPQPWQLIGYRLEDTPYYQDIQPASDGSLVFETIGLRFQAVGRERIEVYNATTGERLLAPDELKTKAAEEEARANAEAEARASAEARVADLERRLRELEAQYPDQAKSESNSNTEMF